MPVAGTVISASNLPRQLSDGNDQGTTMGFAPTGAQGGAAADKVGFFGAAVVQPSGNAQAALVRGQAGGSVFTYASAQSPSGVTTLTSAEYSLTVQNGTGATMTFATTDLFIANKPTAQAGLGMGNVRYSSTTAIGLSFQNYTATMITPTASQIYGFTALRGLNTVTAVLTPAAVSANSTGEQIFTVTGIRQGEVVMVNKPTTNVGLDIAGVRVAGNNQVGVTFVNVTAGALTPTAGQTYTLFSTGGIDAVHAGFLAMQLNATATPATVAAAQVANITITSSNILVDDTVVAIQKPTLQASVAIANGYVSAVSTLKVNAVNATVTVATPTASEVYTATFFRPAPAAPCVIYTQTLTPSSVAANTTAEQTFVVTGVVAGSSIVVNKPTSQAGLGIVGARVSSANNIAITFCNATATTITPVAGEVYAVANFQAQIDATGGNAMMQPAAVAQFGNVVLTNALRNALAGGAGTGLIAGA